MGRVEVITWSIGADNSTRIAHVKIHYVDENGTTIPDPAQIPDTESDKSFLESGTAVDLATWAEDNDVSKISGYTYIGTRDGTTITGLLAKEASTSGDTKYYKLYYTTAETVDANNTSDWTLYSDANTNSESNNADVYLVYTEDVKAPVTFHFLTLDSQEIKDADGNAITKVVDGATMSNGVDLIAWGTVAANVPNQARDV